MLYTPKYIYNNDLDKTICKCAECKKYRILYCHTDMVENKKESTKEMNSDIIAVCSKCGSTYRFNLKHISFKNGDKYEVGRVAFIEEKYPQVKAMEKLIDLLEDDDDVQNVFHNWEQE